MHIGVPACRQRQIVVARDGNAEHSDFAGAGDVDEIGIEAFQNFIDDGQMAQIGRVEAQVFFEWNGEENPRELQGPDIADFFECPWPMSGAYAEKGQIMPMREGFKMAAGVGNPVYLMEGVGEVCNSRTVRSWMRTRVQPSCSPSARRRWPSSLHAMRSPPDTGALPSICTALMAQ